jgi:small GTP-binding protein
MTTESTVGAAFLTKVFTAEGVSMRLDIWDTGGSERYKSLAPMYYRDARAAIVVFDVTDPKSETDAVAWLNEVREHGRKDVIFLAAANKCDLINARKIGPNEVNDFKFRNQLEFIQETSAKTGMGVVELFTECIRLLARMPAVAQSPPVVSREDVSSESRCRC